MNVIDSATSFEELKFGFISKIADLKILNQIRGGWGKDSVDEINLLAKELKSMSQTMINFRVILQNGRREIDELKKAVHHLDLLSERLTYIKNNLPAHIPNAQSNSQSSIPEQDPQPQNLVVHKSKTTGMVECKAEHQKKLKQTDDIRAAKGPKPISKLEYITLDEHESIPSYTRGRISYEKINAAIDCLNKALEGKYNLIRKPRSKLTPIELSMVTEYKKQLNQECKGMHFITDDDMKKHAGMKLDTSGRNILTILRTLKRLKEVRGPGSLVRFCFL